MDDVKNDVIDHVLSTLDVEPEVDMKQEEQVASMQVVQETESKAEHIVTSTVALPTPNMNC